MLKNNKSGSALNCVIAVLLSFLTVLGVFFNGEKIGRLFVKAAPVGAVLSMPSGVSGLVKREKKTVTNAKTNTYFSFENESRSAPETATVLPVSKAADEFVTPDDVLTMRDEYNKKFPASKKSGKIEEMHYSSKNANVKYENVFVKNTTSFDLDIEKELDKKATLEIKDKSKPSVLIFHTHTTESYEMADNGWYCADYATRSRKSDRNMIRVGNEIQKQLENAGFNVIHDTTVHDLKYNGAYSRSRETVEKILKENPTIQVVLDVHRDAIYQQNGVRVKPVCEINSKKCAQVMIITGCEDGDVEDFPDWEKNLVFALQLQRETENRFEGLMRPVMFCNRKYNMDLTECSLLLEFGSDSNTLEEAMYSGFLLGRSLASYLEGYVKK
ncbi:MAG: stage II sporulation protein P [Clostridiales bacterium]|nr:stage II sporulation protein P [Clostridiales bacterium]